MLKNILIFGAGLVIGALGAGYIVKKKMDDDFEEKMDIIIDEEIEAYKVYSKKKESKEKVGEIISEEEKDAKEEMSATINRDSKVYAKLAHSYAGKDEDEDLTEDEEENYRKWEKISEKANNHSDDLPPHVITFEQFNLEKDHFDKISLTYYWKDATLVDENEEPMDDVIGTVGDGALVSFGLGSQDNDIVYIRNYNLEIDYEIVRVDKSYKVTVLGMVGDQ